VVRRTEIVRHRKEHERRSMDGRETLLAGEHGIEIGGGPGLGAGTEGGGGNSGRYSTITFSTSLSCSRISFKVPGTSPGILPGIGCHGHRDPCTSCAHIQVPSTPSAGSCPPVFLLSRFHRWPCTVRKACCKRNQRSSSLLRRFCIHVRAKMSCT
jgi:hypothetical protein